MRRFLAPFALAASLPAQTLAYSIPVSPPGCGYAVQGPVQNWMPILGQTAAIQTTGTFDGAFVAGVISFTKLDPPIPLSCPIFAAGCTQSVPVDAMVWLTSFGGTATWYLTIPNDPALEGCIYYTQVVADTVAHGSNPAIGFTTTNPVESRIGTY